MKKIILLTIVFFSFVISTNAQAGFSKNVSALATVVAPIEIGSVINMQFGDISRMAATGGTPTDGVLTMSTAGAVTTTSGGVQAIAGGTTTTAASITVTGEETATFSLVITEATPLTIATIGQAAASSTNTMELTNFTQSGAAAGNLLSASGSLTITIGADLAVDKAQETGSYTGSILVVAQYE